MGIGTWFESAKAPVFDLEGPVFGQVIVESARTVVFRVFWGGLAGAAREPPTFHAALWSAPGRPKLPVTPGWAMGRCLHIGFAPLSTSWIRT